MRAVQGLPEGTEATISFTLDGKAMQEAVGKPETMRVAVQDLDTPYISLHNHASNGILSPEDIFSLIRHDKMQAIGAVGNKGALFTCEKVFGYRKDVVNRWIDSLCEKYPLYKSQDASKINDVLEQRLAFANELCRDGEKHGLRFSG